jgi:hypothetical protein
VGQRFVCNYSISGKIRTRSLLMQVYLGKVPADVKELLESSSILVTGGPDDAAD